jgi:hypothetical protein
MANPLTFLIPLRYDSVRSVLLVQSGPIDLALEVAERLAATFPDCEVEALVPEDDREKAHGGRFVRVTTVRWEDRVATLRTLRRRRYDAVVVLASSRGSEFLRVLPLLLRTRWILVFNESLDFFPLHVSRVAALAHHVSGAGSMASLLVWLATRAVLMPVVTVMLLGAVGRIYARAAWRRRHALDEGRVHP